MPAYLNTSSCFTTISVAIQQSTIKVQKVMKITTMRSVRKTVSTFCG